MELLSSQRKMAWRGMDKRQFQFVGMIIDSFKW